MKPPSEAIFSEVEEFFASPPTVEEKAWGLIHDFYHILLTYMEQQQMTKAELAKRLGTSRSAVTQMFQKTPNLTLKKMVEIAEAIGVNICLSSPQLQEKQSDNPPSVYVTVQHVLSAPEPRINLSQQMNACCQPGRDMEADELRQARSKSVANPRGIRVRRG